MAGVRVVFGMLVAAGVVAAAGMAAGQVDEAKVLEQRQALMKGVGGNAKALSAILKGESDESPERIRARAMELSEAAQKVAGVFTPEVHVENVPVGLKTTALPNIWTERERFTAAAAELDRASKNLADAADTGDNEKIKAAITDLTKTCGGCHNVFRQKKS